MRASLPIALPRIFVSCVLSASPFPHCRSALSAYPCLPLLIGPLCLSLPHSWPSLPRSTASNIVVDYIVCESQCYSREIRAYIIVIFMWILRAINEMKIFPSVLMTARKTYIHIHTHLPRTRTNTESVTITINSTEGKPGKFALSFAHKYSHTNTEICCVFFPTRLRITS